MRFGINISHLRDGLHPVTIEDNSERDRFYRERDRRTVDYLEGASPCRIPVSVHAGNDACLTRSGQLLLVTLANQLARVHQHVRFSLATPTAALLTPALCNGSSLGDEIQRLLERIDPYGTFDVEGSRLTPAEVSIGVGIYCRPDLCWYLGYDRSNGELAKAPRLLGHDLTADLRGAGLAAILGAAATIKTALHIETVPTIVSAWNFSGGDNADRGPSDLPTIDVGRGLMVGGGAVAAGAVYWLMQWGNASSWTIEDGDFVKLHNTNRCLLFFPDDAGWLDRKPKSKVACLSQYLPSVRPVHAWYDETAVSAQQFDTTLVLANERDVRTFVSHRNDPIQFQATTGRSWLSQLHRHIIGRDDCVRCRMSDIKEPRLACSEVETATSAQPVRPDAALPFLSAASGLMLVSALQHLQLGEFGEDSVNTWRWDFRTTLQIDSSGHHVCRHGCSTLLSSDARRTIVDKTRWLDQPWLAEGCDTTT